MELRTSLPALLFVSAVVLQSVSGAVSRTGPKVTEKVGADILPHLFALIQNRVGFFSACSICIFSWVHGDPAEVLCYRKGTRAWSPGMRGETCPVTIGGQGFCLRDSSRICGTHTHTAVYVSIEINLMRNAFVRRRTHAHTLR